MHILSLTWSVLHRFRLRLRSLIALVFVIAVGLAAGVRLERTIHRAQVQRRAVAAIEGAGGRVAYDYQWKDLRPNPGGKPSAPRWLVKCLGVDFFADVTWVEHRGFRAGFRADAVASEVAKLERLESVDFSATDLTDAGLAQLSASPVRSISLVWARKITDAGLVHLGAMTGLERINLSHSNVGDAGLAHLERLPDLRFLHLDGTKITDAGMRHVARMHRLTAVSLHGTAVGDPGFDLLRSLDEPWLVIFPGMALRPSGVR